MTTWRQVHINRRFKYTSLVLFLLAALFIVSLLPAPKSEKQQAACAQGYDISIVANSRPRALRALTHTVQDMLPRGCDANVTLYLESNQHADMAAVVDETASMFDHLRVAERIVHGGLIAAVAEAWTPRRNGVTFALFLEDDLLLSPAADTWLQKTMPWCRNHSKCLGISLYTPRIDEINARRYHRRAVLARLPNIYAQQLPCSWGAAYRSDLFGICKRHMADRLHEPHKQFGLVLGRLDRWNQSWKKFFAECMAMHGFFLLYPNFEEQRSFSTNTLAVGEHIVPGDKVHLPRDYTVPLQNTFPESFSWPNTMPILDLYDNRVNVAYVNGRNAQPTHKERESPCITYARSTYPAMPDKVTVVVSHMAGTGRDLASVLQHYCNCGVVAQVVVVWHAMRHPMPSNVMCNNNATMVAFTRGSGGNTLMNRFAPSAYIVTRAVLTVDDDMRMHCTDVAFMLNAWYSNQRRVVGPFARYYDTAGNYKYDDSKAARNGYPFVLTKAHIVDSALFWHVTCNPEYSEFRRIVTETRNSEDLLFMRAAADYFSLPNKTVVPVALLFVPSCGVLDSGEKGRHRGLHSRANHNKDRTAALQLFGLQNDDLWANDQYHAHRGLEPFQLGVQPVVAAFKCLHPSRPLIVV